MRKGATPVQIADVRKRAEGTKQDGTPLNHAPGIGLPVPRLTRRGGVFLAMHSPLPANRWVYFTVTSIWRGLACSDLGNLISRTPLSSLADTFSGSMSKGSVKEREKLPNGLSEV